MTECVCCLRVYVRVQCVFLILTCSRLGAGLAGLVPGLAYIVGTATDLLGEVEGQLILTGGTIVVPVA